MRRRLVLLFSALVLVAAAYPSVAAATTVDFETPALANGTIVDSQFASQGVTFGAVPAHDGQAPGARPVMHVGEDASSGTHALDISTNEAEFPVPSLEGEFSSTQHDVSIYLRNVTPGTFTVRMQLQLFDAQHHLLATSGAFTSLPSTNTGYVGLSASTSGDAASFWVVTDGSSDAQGQTVLADDLSFDEPAGGAPEISLNAASHGTVVVQQGGTAPAAVEIQRLDGSNGDVTLSTSGLPTGVTARESPNPVTGTGSSATVTFSAAINAPTFSTPVAITVTGTPGSGAGDTPATTTINLIVQPYTAGDVAATGIEVNQAIQTPNDAIPLVGDKETAVRVYLRGAPDPAGPWTGVSARLLVGTHVYTPVNAPSVTASATGSDRNNLTDSFLFVLSPEDTLPGRRTFTAQISPPAGRRESNTANDSVSTTVTFGPSRDFELYGFTYANTNPALAEPPWSDFEAHREYMLNVHPIGSLAILHLPGDPQMSFDNRDGSAYLTADSWLDDEVARLYPTGSVTAYLMTPENGPRYSGWCCTGSPNWVLRGDDLRADPGPTLAHESSHRWGLVHTFEDPHYPRPTGALGGPLGPQVGVRFAPTVSVVPGEDDAGNSIMNDMMSYTAPFWVSPYTYCNLLSGYTAGAISCTPAAKAASVNGPGSPLDPAVSAAPRMGIRSGSKRFLFVTGVVYPTGKATLGSAEQIATATKLRSRSQGKEFTVELRGSSGKVLASWGFDQFTKFHAEPVPAPFSAYIRDPRGARSLVIVSHGKVIARQRISRHAPKLKARAPRGKELRGVETIRWKGSDADHQRLTYSVEYSADHGKTWIPLDVDLHGESARLNFGLVPISKRAELRVAASDGANTTYARVGRTFRVPGGSPSVTIAPTSPVSAGASTVLEAQALDSEGNGMFDDTSYTWSESGRTIGTGRWLVTVLKPGLHTVTVAVDDRFGHTAQTSALVQVG